MILAQEVPEVYHGRCIHFGWTSVAPDPHHLPGPFSDPLKLLHVSLISRSQKLDTQLQSTLTRAEGQNPPLTFCPCHGQEPRTRGISAQLIHVAEHGPFFIHPHPKPFSSRLFSIHSSPTLQPCLALLQTRCRTLHLVLFSFVRLTISHIPNLFQPLWMPCLPSTQPPTLLVSSECTLVLLIVPLNPSAQISDNEAKL